MKGIGNTTIGSDASAESVVRRAAVETRPREAPTRKGPPAAKPAATRAAGVGAEAATTTTDARVATGEETETIIVEAVGRVPGPARRAAGIIVGGSTGTAEIETVRTATRATTATAAAGMMIVVMFESVRPHLNLMKMSEIAALSLSSSLQPACVPAN